MSSPEGARPPRAGVIGGGPSGLATAYFLAKSGLKVDLYEAAPVFGGLASPVVYNDATFDRYYHYLCLEDSRYWQLCEELGIGNRVRFTHPQMGYLVDGTIYPFRTPLDLLRFRALSPPGRVRYGLGALSARRRRKWQGLDHLDAPTWLRRTFGEESFAKLWAPILAGKFGDHGGEVSAAWMWARFDRVATSREKGMWRERMGYVEGGTATFIGAVTTALHRLGASLRLRSPIEQLVRDDRRWLVGETHYDAAVCAMPLPKVARLVQNEALLEGYLDGVRYAGVACYAAVCEASLTPYFWLNVVDRRAPFVVVVEYTNLDPKPELQGRLIYVPHYLPPDHDYFSLDEAAIKARTLAALERLFPSFRRQQVKRDWVFRDRFAQAICPPGFGRRLPPLRTALPRLYCVENIQLYPRDRTIAGSIALAEKCARLVQQDVQVST